MSADQEKELDGYGQLSAVFNTGPANAERRAARERRPVAADRGHARVRALSDRVSDQRR